MGWMAGFWGHLGRQKWFWEWVVHGSTTLAFSDASPALPCAFLTTAHRCGRRHEAEKKTLNDQLAKTMKLFQEQLAQTVKMAAMLQAQRIMTGAPPAAAPELPSMPLPHEVDEPPTVEEIEEYAQ